MNKLVSIITPSYNSARFILDCCNSVLAQSYRDWELLIVDDCSVDNSKELIIEFAEKDARIKPIFLEANVGAAAARNVAIRKAAGKYIAFLDSDDVWSSNKLEKQLDFMQMSNISFSFTSYQPISENGSVVSPIIEAPAQITYTDYLKNTIIGCLTVIIDKEAVGDFEMPNIRSSHDMALWLLILKRGHVAYGLNENLAQYRIVSNSNTSNKIKSALEVWKVYREVEKIGFLLSLWYFIHYSFNALKKRL